MFKSFLETNLSQLFKKLTKLRESFKTVQTGDGLKEAKKKSDLMPLHKENLKTQLNECLEATGESCKLLFDLSLVVPSAPWVNHY